MCTWLGHLRSRGLPCRLTALAGAVVCALTITAPVATHLGGSTALATAALAAGVCWAGAAAGLAVGNRLVSKGTVPLSSPRKSGQSPHGALAALWIAMLARTGVPLAVALAIQLHAGPLAQAGFLWYLVVFYPITLTVGTVLSLPPGGQPSANAAPPTRAVRREQ